MTYQTQPSLSRARYWTGVAVGFTTAFPVPAAAATFAKADLSYRTARDGVANSSAEFLSEMAAWNLASDNALLDCESWE